MRRRRKRGAVTNIAFNIGAQNWLLWRLPVSVRSSFFCLKGMLEEMKALRSDVSKLMGTLLFCYVTWWIFVFEELNNDCLGGKFKSNIRREILSGWEMYQKETCWHVVRMVDSGCTYSFGEETWKGKSSRGKPRSRWKGNIKIIDTETGFYGVEWIYLAREKNKWWTLANAVMNHGDL